MVGQQAISPTDIFLPSDSAEMSEIRHELRTHLNHIVGYSEMIMEEADDVRWAAGRRAMEDIIEISQELTESISNIIRYLDSGDRDHCAEAINSAAQPLVYRITRLADQASTGAGSAGHQEMKDDASRVVHACKNITECFGNGLRPTTVSTVDRTPAHPTADTRDEIDSKSGNGNDSETQSARILAVDDNAINLTLLTRFCERRGHSVTAVGSGEDALTALDAGDFDLVILDIMLPGINGFEVLERISKSDKINVPVIILSSLDDVESMVTCLRMGAEDFLRKPFVAEILEARIQVQIDKKLSSVGQNTGLQMGEPQNPDELSPREIEVLTHLAMGKSNREIGEDLFITENTVVRHVSNIFSKAGLANRAVAGVYAVQLGLVKPVV
jgi:DNA-binding NarL/FixJ family response regulator